MSETIGAKKVQVNQFQIIFTSKKITAYGGFSLLAKFFKKIGLPGVLSKAFPVPNLIVSLTTASKTIDDANLTMPQNNCTIRDYYTHISTYGQYVLTLYV